MILSAVIQKLQMEISYACRPVEGKCSAGFFLRMQALLYAAVHEIWMARKSLPVVLDGLYVIMNMNADRVTVRPESAGHLIGPDMAGTAAPE